MPSSRALAVRRRPQAWTAVLALLLAALSGYAVVVNRHQAQLVERVASAGRDMNAYDQAAFRVAREMVVVQAVLREPYGKERAEIGAADQLAAVAMSRMARTDREHGTRAAAIVRQHALLRPAIERFLRQLDRGAVRQAKITLERDIDPTYDEIMRALLEDQIVHLAEYDRLAAAAASDADRSMITGLIIFGLVLTVLGLLAFSTRAYRRQVEAMAATDGLTGLPNRVAFTAHTERALAGGPTVLVVNIDGFRDVNDQLGPSVGDQLLIEVGRRLTAAVRDGDVVARLGGDEFAILLPAAGDGVAASLAERLTEAFEAPFAIDDMTADLEVSIGAAAAAPGDDAAAVLRQADAAMHTAKQQRAGFRVYDAGRRRDVAARLTLLGDLRRALDDTDQITLYYQPKITIGSGEIAGVEALARWRHPTRGPIPPTEFVPVLEATGLMHRFTDRVLTVALRQARRWRDAGHPVVVAVNVSTRSLLEASFPGRVAQLLAEAGVPGEQLAIEVTEHTLMSDPEAAIDALHRVRRLGVKTSVDDYGTGYSSMTYLKVLPVDELKIDRYFVRDMAVDPGSRALVASTVDLGHSLGLTVVAEGVEDAETLAELLAVGCDVAQGYHFARPMPADDLTGRLGPSRKAARLR